MLAIGSFIYIKRLEKKMTQKALAAKAGVPQPNLSNIEKGKQDITVSTLRRIGHALDVPTADFFLDDVHSTSPTRLQLTRSVIEKLARGVTDQSISLNAWERGVAARLREILPGKHKRYARVKRTHQAWVWLRQHLRRSEINSLCARVREVNQ